MKKYFSLIRAVMSEEMNLFKISTKKNNVFSKIGLPVFYFCDNECNVFIFRTDNKRIA